jgi:hypothetical protein
MDKKAWYVSKTIWFNTFVAAMLLAEQNISALQGLLPDSTYKLAAFSVPFVNMLLRVISTKGLAFSQTSGDPVQISPAPEK